MGERTAIGWTDHTFNPWWGCERVSPGCQHCYAEAFAKRTGHDVWGKAAGRRFFGDKHWNEPVRWNTAAEAAGRPALVFCSSMADVFEDRPELVEHRARLFELIEQTPWLRWQLLTKRPENVLDLVPAHWLRRHTGTVRVAVGGDQSGEIIDETHVWHPSRWPSNAWLGTTVEDQQRADERIPALLAVPAQVRFLSCEPLLGLVDLDPWFACPGACSHEYCGELSIDWVIVGGESGPGHRPMDPAWARTLVEQCQRVDVPVFFKQWGGRTPTAGGDLLDGAQIKEFPPEAGDRSIS